MLRTMGSLAIDCLIVVLLGGFAVPNALAQGTGSDVSPTGSAPSAPAGPTPASGNDPTQTLKLPDQNAITGTPVNFTGWLRRGSTLLQMNDYEGALEAVRNAIAIEKDNIVAHIMLGDVLVKLHRYPEAETEYQVVMLRQPTDTSIVAKLGDLYMEQGNFVNAQNMYRKVLASEPKNQEALMSLARAFEGSNDLSSASECYERCLRDFPNTNYALAAQSRINQLGKAQEQARSDRFFPIDGELGAEGFGWWDLKKMPLHVYIDDGSDSRGFRPEMIQSVLRALQAWSGASHNAITFVVSPPDPYREAEWKKSERQSRVLTSLKLANLANMPGDPIPAQIHVHWSDHLPSASGLAWTSKVRDGNPTITKAHVWLETDKLINGQKVPLQPTPAMASIFEAQSQMLAEVAMHELGHALGLVHLSNPNDIMAPGLVGLRSGEPSVTRELSPRDVKALVEHYDYFRNSSTAPPTVSQLAQEIPDSRSQPPAGNSAPSMPPEPDASRTDSSGATERPSGTAGADGEEPEHSLLGKPGSAEERQTKSNNSGSASYGPLREAMFLISTRQYDKSLETLNKVLSVNANNSQARYLRACVYVFMRQYPQAASDYRQVLKLSPNTELGKRAAEGLKRINP